MVRVGVLGAGFMGGMHARCYAALPDVEVAKVYARTAERAEPLASELGTTWTDNLEDILNDDTIDAVSVCLPTPQHPDATEKLLEHGKHVLVEKPIAGSEEEGQRIVDAAERSDRVVMAGHVIRFWPEYVELQRIVAQGQLGTPLSGFASRRSPLPAWSDMFLNASITGGAVIDLQVHDLDILNWIFGTPKTVFAGGIQSPKTGGWDHGLITVGYGRATATAEGSMMMPDSYPFSSALRVLCEDGCIEYNFQAGGRSVEMGSSPDSGLVLYPAKGDPEPLSAAQEDPYQAQITYFVECVRNGSKPERATPEQGLQAIRVALAARESMQTGNCVNL